MAGHSQFKNIMYRKGAQDKKRGKVFTKLIRELTTAARHGLPDPAANPRLRAAILAARAGEHAEGHRRARDQARRRRRGGEAYEEVRYEGYGPGGIAVIVEALTDNRNRTASEVRAAFTKSGGDARRDQQRRLHVRARRRDRLSGDGGQRRRRCSRRRSRPAPTMSIERCRGACRDLARRRISTAVRDALESALRRGRIGPARLAADDHARRSTRRPRRALFKMLETLEDSDDVQNVYANFEIADDVMARLSA